jgi:N-acetylneuraminate lyase
MAAADRPVLIAAPHTPWRPGSGLWTEQVAVQARHLAANGVDGVFVGGSTGEWSSLSCADRRRLAEAWVPAAAASGLRLVVHVGHDSLDEAAALARHAAGIGAPAIAALSPSYMPPSRVEDLVAFCAELAAAAPGTPFYYYDIPELTGAAFPMARFLELAESSIPDLAGLKFTNPDLMDLQECLAGFGDRYEILFGRDEELLAGLALGAHGAVGSTYNFAGPAARRLIDAFLAGDLAAARAEQLTLVRLVRALAARGYLAAAKGLMAWLGVDCGQPLPPRAPLPAEAAAALRAELEAGGLLPAA